MEGLLVLVTGISLALATGMGVIAWKLLRTTRDHGDARVAELAALAAAGDGSDTDEMDEIDEMDDLPLAAPARQITLTDIAAPSEWAMTPSSSMAASSPMFNATDERGAPPRRWLTFAMVAIVMGAGVSAVYAVYRPASPGRAPSAAAIGAPLTAKPIELLSLRHTQDQAGDFTVTGLVQNPADGAALAHVVAVIFVFDADGNYIASGRAPIDAPALQPGEESPFVVHVPTDTAVGRYRVGFRFEDGAVVAHVDRRGQAPAGTTAASGE